MSHHRRSLVLLCILATSCDLGMDVDALTKGDPQALDASAPPTDGGNDAGIDGSSSEAGSTGSCPITRGGDMVLSAGVCIDRTEVTNATYLAFLNSNQRYEGGLECDFTGSYVPIKGWPFPQGQENLPVTNVSWCAARAFCQVAGKRLCGRLNADTSGGPLDPGRLGTEEDEWTTACRGDAKFTYPYGNTFVADACNGDAFGARVKRPAGTLATCGASGGPRDLSGNVFEWTDACGDDDLCYARGGAYNSPASDLACQPAPKREKRDGGVDDIGFRCCARRAN